MNTTCFDAELVSPSRAEWRPAFHHWVETMQEVLGHLKVARHHHMSDSELTALDGLNPETLKDIGAPEWMQERARPGRWSALDPAYWR